MADLPDHPCLCDGQRAQIRPPPSGHKQPIRLQTHAVGEFSCDAVPEPPTLATVVPVNKAEPVITPQPRSSVAPVLAERPAAWASSQTSETSCLAMSAVRLPRRLGAHGSGFPLPRW